MAIEIRDGCTLMSVWDMPTTVRFYRELLGFEIVQRSPTYAMEGSEELFHWCMMRSNAACIMLNTEYDEGERPAERPHREETRFGTWFYYGCPDLDDAYEKLNAAAVGCKRPGLTMYGGKYGFRTLSFRDPDGHGITLQWPDSSAE
jgi:catechol 2,3-dioxygenase-like lactoylglutathione lyase family enzyme